MPVVNWFKSPAVSNDLVDQPAGVIWNEGMFGPQYNDSARAMMAEIAKWRDDLNGTLTTDGTSTAYTVNTNQDFAALVDGLEVFVTLHAVPGAAATFSPDGLTAKPIRVASGVALPSGSGAIGTTLGLRYSLADDCWYVIKRSLEFATAAEARAQATAGKALTPASMQSVLPLGVKMLFFNAAAPVGWAQVIDESVNARAIRLVGAAAGGIGGTHGFTTVFNATRTPAGVIGGTALVEANLPPHRHLMLAPLAVGGSSAVTGANQVALQGLGLGDADYESRGTATDATAGRTGAAGSGTTHTHSFSGTAMDFDVKYTDAMICERTAA